MQAEHKPDPKPFYLSNVWLKRWQDFLHCETLGASLYVYFLYAASFMCQFLYPQKLSHQGQ